MMDKVKVLLKNKTLVKYALMAGLAAAGYSLPPEAVDAIVSLIVAFQPE